MSTTAVNISFQKDLLSDIDRTAKDESRSRSELLREAARMYIDRKKRWNRIFAAGRSVAREKGLSPSDVATEIRTHRRRKARPR